MGQIRNKLSNKQLELIVLPISETDRKNRLINTTGIPCQRKVYDIYWSK